MSKRASLGRLNRKRCRHQRLWHTNEELANAQAIAMRKSVQLVTCCLDCGKVLRLAHTGHPVSCVLCGHGIGEIVDTPIRKS